MLHSLLEALRRYEPDFYTHICRAYHVEPDKIMGLFSQVDQLAPAQLLPMLAEMRQNNSYHDIAYLAGRNAAHKWAVANKANLALKKGGIQRFVKLANDTLPQFTGQAGFSIETRGSICLVELPDTLFSREATSINPLCGFYTGLLYELASACTLKQVQVVESSCRAQSGENMCVFEVPL